MSPTPPLFPHRCRWEAHLRTKELSGTSPAHTCMPCQVGPRGPCFRGGECPFRGWDWPGWGLAVATSSLCGSVPEDSDIRCEQLNMLQDWLADFRKSTSSSSTANPEELVAFDIICGDFNFDNCSSGEACSSPLGLATGGGVGSSQGWQDWG